MPSRVKAFARLAGLALMASGILAISIHPWGLTALVLGGLGTLAAAWERGPAIPSPKLPPRHSRRWWAYGLGILATILAGSELFLIFNEPGRLNGFLAEDWPRVAAWALLALVGSGAAAMALRENSAPAKPPRPGRTLPAGRSPGSSWAFVALCLLSAILVRFLPLAAALLAVAALGFSVHPDRPKPQSRFWPLGCALLLALGAVLRLWDLENLPQGLNGEEALTLSIARNVVLGEAQAFVWSAGFTGVTLFHHAVGWLYRLLQAEATAVPLRLTSVLGWGVFTVYAALLSARLFSWRAAFACAAYLSLSFLALHYGRMGFYFIWGPAMGAAILAHSTWALRGRWQALHLAATAFWCAAAAYGWISGYVTPLLVLIVLAGNLRWTPEQWLGRLPALLGAFLLFTALAGPALLTFIHFPGGLGSYSTGFSGSFLAQVEPKGGLSEDLLLHLKELLITGITEVAPGVPVPAMHYLPGAPVLSGPVLFFVLMGLAALLRQPAGGPQLAVLLSLLLGFLPLWLGNPDGRNLGRAVVLILPFAMLFGLGASVLAEVFATVNLSGAAAPLSSLALGAAVLSLTREVPAYFLDYRHDPRAIAANSGPSAVAAHAACAGLAEDEPLFFGERFSDARAFLHLLPNRARRVFLREAPDLAGLIAAHPHGTLVSGPSIEDWLPWLQATGATVDYQPVEMPWAQVSLADKAQFRTLDKGRLAGIIRWRSAKAQRLRQTGPGRWEGYLWVARPDRYQVVASEGRLSLDGSPAYKTDEQGSWRFQSVPYRVRVEGAPREPELAVFVYEGVPLQHPSTFVFPEVDFSGLRKTLRSKDPGLNDFPTVSLRPVVAQRFDPWSAEQGISTVHYPMEGAWEGSLKVPEKGQYRFSVPNNMEGRVSLRIDGKELYRSRRGDPELSEAVYLLQDRSYSVAIQAEEIGPTESLRFVVAAPGEVAPKAVPYPWLSPAPLPRALSLRATP